MIDAVLALTEGRGGTFRFDGNSYDYEPSGREPGAIVAWSRTARPMLAKPDESRFRPTHDLEKVWQSGRKQLARVPRPVGKSVLNCVVRPILMNAARRALTCTCPGDEVPSEAVLDRWFRRWCDHSMTGDEAISLLRNSFEVAVAKRQPGIAWSLGAAWRGLYPALVELVSHGGLMPEAWPAFRRLECEMERLAFGPPAENVGRLLALFDCGLVQVRSLPDDDDHQQKSRSGVTNDSAAQVRYIDAVLPSPHEHAPAGPLAQLLKAGWIERMVGASGIHVDACGHPITHDSSTPVGLAVFGRATEGCVLGNDTLSRTLHKHPLRWAETLVQRCCRKVTS
jgi:diaminopimelate decarboxylase